MPYRQNHAVIRARVSGTFSNVDKARKWYKAFAPIARRRGTVRCSNFNVAELRNGYARLTFDYEHEVNGGWRSDLNRFIQKATQKLRPARPIEPVTFQMDGRRTIEVRS